VLCRPTHEALHKQCSRTVQERRVLLPALRAQLSRSHLINALPATSTPLSREVSLTLYSQLMVLTSDAPACFAIGDLPDFRSAKGEGEAPPAGARKDVQTIHA
jgi:hypothetical protein